VRRSGGWPKSRYGEGTFRRESTADSGRVSPADVAKKRSRATSVEIQGKQGGVKTASEGGGVPASVRPADTDQWSRCGSSV